MFLSGGKRPEKSKTYFFTFNDVVHSSVYTVSNGMIINTDPKMSKFGKAVAAYFKTCVLSQHLLEILSKS
jgi:hypothetical protein